jgi:hypothetical protein
MKKTARKLAVSKETLARLDARNLRELAGGLLQLNDTVYRTEPVPVNDTVYHPVQSDRCSVGCGSYA